MNCRTCQYELSQCLDGRLASGRRALVMDHVAECVRCAGFWRELQSAQALVLRLERPRVHADFREGLFERIEAGEGTPPSVFHEPVSVATKVRYTLTGAAAAAAVLVAATLLQKEALPVAPSPSAAIDRAAPVAVVGSTARASLAADYVPSAASSPLQLRESALDNVRPLTPDLVAVEAAREFEQRYVATMRLLDRGLDDATTARAVCNNAEEIHHLGRVLVDLRDANWLSFRDARVDADLRVLVTLLDGNGRPDNTDGVEIVRSTIAPAVRKSPSLQRLTESLSIAPSFARDGQLELLRFSRSFPQIFDRMFLVLPQEQATVDLDPRRETFRFQDGCGTIFVTRRLPNR